MSAIQAIIQTYLRFSDERALLALKAHRVKLLASIDERNPFFQNLRSQCREEIFAIEEGLATFHKPLPPVNGTIFADVRSLPGGGLASPTEIANGPVNLESDLRPVTEGTGNIAAPQKSALPPNNFVSSIDRKVPSYNSVASDSAASQDEPPLAHRSTDRLGAPDMAVQPADRSGAEPAAPMTRATASFVEAEQAESGILKKTAGTAVTSSLIESWFLQLQEGPYQVELDWSSMESNKAELRKRFSSAAEGRLLTGLHSFTNIIFSQRSDA